MRYERKRQGRRKTGFQMRVQTAKKGTMRTRRRRSR
jgi:hypothetical protein